MAKKPHGSSDSDNENANENASSEEESLANSEGDNVVSDSGDNNNENGFINSGWADSVSKILKTNKPKGKKSIVLSKAKKLTDVKKDLPKSAGFEVQTADGEIKEEKVEVIKIESTLEGEPPQKKKRIVPNFRVKPNILEKDRERTLQKIATKGVVQLFNAVRMQQKQISEKLEEAGPLEVRKERVMKNIDKRAFLDVLMGGKSQKIDEFDVKTETSSKNKNEYSKDDSTWSVLKDDFMMSAKMKDWDKELEDSDDGENISTN